MYTVSEPRIYFEKHGCGKPLILVHGNGEDCGIFDALIDALKDRFEIYAVDSRGHGKSDSIAEYHYSDMADDIIRLMDEQNIIKPCLFGFSDGGIVGILCGVQHSDLFDKIIVAGANITVSGLKTYARLGMRLNYLVRHKDMTRMMLTEPSLTTDDLGGISCPFLVLAGQWDLIKQQHTELIANSIPNSKLTIFQHQLHGSYIVHSAFLADTITDFCFDSREQPMIFEKTTISGINVNNRIFRSATHDGLADPNGAPSDELIRKYANLAKNEVGCIITGYASVSQNGVSPYPRMLTIFDDSNVQRYRDLTDAVHANGAPIVLQLAHCGRQTSTKAIGHQKVAPSNVLHTFYPDPAEVLDDQGIHAIIDDFVAAAVRAEQAGFDAVQLHGGHGYLLHDFMSSFGNRRTDSWGGSVENRCRIVELIVKGIKAQTSLPVWIKISATDNRKNGMNPFETIQILQILQAAGLDAVEISCGTVQDGMSTMRSKVMPMDAVFKYREPVASMPNAIKSFSLKMANLVNPLIKQPSPLENFNVDNARSAKMALSIPVIVVGGIHTLDDMESIVQSKSADFVSMCRPFICEPNLVRKLHDGTQSQAKCLMCNYCGLVIEKEPTRCLYGRIK